MSKKSFSVFRFFCSSVSKSFSVFRFSGFSVLILCLLVTSLTGCDTKKQTDDGDWSFDDNILLSIFWPPTDDYVNDKQWKYMQDAEIDWVLGAGDVGGDYETQSLMLELCEKYGLHMCVADSRLGSKTVDLSTEEVAEIITPYTEYESSMGYFICDEPTNPNNFISAYLKMKNADPDSYVHLNFLPYYVYDDIETYMAQMDDWCKLCEMSGYPLEYLMYDLYPFGLEEGSFNRTAFLKNLNAARIVGLENNVKTASYIQSVEQEVAFRSLNKAETLFEMNMCLAFGQKQLSFFTWFTPEARDEPFDDGIISALGKPNAKYKFICELNHYVHTIGETLVKCDALEVYTTGNGSDVLNLLPEDFFVKSVDEESDVLVSLMKNKETGRNYLMIVNNSFDSSETCELKFDESIKSLEAINNKTGKTESLKMKNNQITLELEAGAARIIVLPEDFDYPTEETFVQKDGENLAVYADISADSSWGEEGYYMTNLNDGVIYSSESNMKGWCSDDGSSSTIILKFDDEVTFNRVDLYPCGEIIDYNAEMAGKYVISASNDGVEFNEIATYKLEDFESSVVPSVSFAETKAKYIKIEISEYLTTYTSLCEIEVYNDKGTIPAPVNYLNYSKGKRGTTKVEYEEGVNLAENKSTVSSPYSAEKVTCTIDLGDTFNIERFAFKLTREWPEGVEIYVSGDYSNWTKVYDVENLSLFDYPPAVGNEGIILNNCTARYVKVIFKDLPEKAYENYSFEIYGTPSVDYDEANEILQYYLDNGGKDTDILYKSVKNMVDEKGATTTQSTLDVSMRKMLNHIGKTFEDVK